MVGRTLLERASEDLACPRPGGQKTGSEGQEGLRSQDLDPQFPAQCAVAAELGHLGAYKQGCSQPMSFYTNQGSFVSIDNPGKGETYPRDLRGNRYDITKRLHVVVVTGLTSSCKQAY